MYFFLFLTIIITGLLNHNAGYFFATYFFIISANLPIPMFFYFVNLKADVLFV